MKNFPRHRETFHSFDDPLTGRKVTRLTSLEHHCYHPYFYYPQFTADGQRLLYISHRTGRAQAYLMELETGDACQITDAKALNSFTLMLTADGRELYFTDDSVLKRLDIETGAETMLFHPEPPWGGGYPGFSDDGRFAFFCQIHQDDVLPDDVVEDRLLLQYLAKPRCRLLLLDTASGELRILREEPVYLGHPQIRPGDPTTLMFCHEGPSSRVDTRIWLIDADGGEPRPVGYRRSMSPECPNAMNTHEYFTPDGQHIAYCYFPEKYLRDGRLRTTHIDTGVETDLGPVHDYAHPFHSPNGRMVVGDESSLDPAKKADCCLWLFDVENRRETRLALHGSSFAHRGLSTQDAHPHPLFTPDSKRVLFTSDRETGPTGNCSIYLVDTV